MRITKITTYAIKSKVRYDMGGDSSVRGQLPGSDYLRFDPFPQLYSQRSEAMLVKVETDAGFTGWGETQAPIAPEVAQAVVERILGPAVLGRDPLDTNLRFTEMFETMRVRGHVTGFQLDAIAGIDTALWDIRGKAANMSVSALLGGRYRETLPCYSSGLRQKTRAARIDEAKAIRDQGISGIKPFMGYGIREDGEELAELRAALGPTTKLCVDGVWRYNYGDAVRVARQCEAAEVEFFEAPMVPEDVRGHARLAAEVDVPIAIGEPLRTRFQFAEWFLHDAFDVCQPDVMRNGISETMKIAALAETFNKPVALHTGCVTVVGMAATFHCAAAVPNFLIQELQPVMFDTFNAWLRNPLSLEDGEIVVPDGPGLGLDLDEERLLADVDSKIEIAIP